jgi:predicted nucleotide-binding protein
MSDVSDEGEAMATDLEDLPPRVFVASSRSSASLAHRLADRLKPDIAADVWDTQFNPGDFTLDNLLLFSSLYEFGIFVLSTDDLTLGPANVLNIEPRDNVIFELGIFMGAVGRSRAFAVVVDDGRGDVKLPTDLAGATYVKITPGALEDNVGAEPPTGGGGTVATIRSRILQLSRTAPLSLLPGTSLAIGYYQNFLLPVGNHLQECDLLKTSASTLDVGKRGYEFSVLIPETLAKVGIPDRDNYVRRRALTTASLPPYVEGKPRRSYDFFVDETANDGPVQLFDYPTTLRAAYEAIRLVVPEKALGERKSEHDILAAREIRTFGRALTTLLAGPDGQVFRSPVKICYI